MASSALITTAVFHGLQAEEVQIKRAAAYALENAIDFCSKHFETPEESKVLLNAIMNAAIYPDEDLQCTCLTIFIDVAFMHYDALEPFIEVLFKVFLSMCSIFTCR